MGNSAELHFDCFFSGMFYLATDAAHLTKLFSVLIGLSGFEVTQWCFPGIEFRRYGSRQ